MKRKTDRAEHAHVIPLSSQAAALFQRAVELSRARSNGHHVFPGHGVGRHNGTWAKTHLSRHGLSSAMRDACKLAGVSDMRLHDLRKVVTTWLGERHERADVLDRILHHAPRGVTERHYNFATLEGPVRAALQRWADHVGQITGQLAAAPSNVVALATARA